MGMRVEPIRKDLFPEWDDFVDRSDDAWFWHRRAYIEFRIELAGRQHVRDESFLLFENASIVAICPAVIEACSEGKSQYHEFAFGGDPLPMPALRNDLSRAKRQEALGQYVTVLKELAAKHEIQHGSFRVPGLAPARCRGGLAPGNQLVRYGFIDLSYQTQVVDLQQDNKALWDDVRKGHKHAVNRAAKELVVEVWEQGSITDGKFEEYQSLHVRDAGRQVRSQKSYEIMREWIKSGWGALIEARAGSSPVAFAFVILFKDGAYYGSGCQDPESRDRGATHLVQWRTIEWLQKKGVRFYELGIQHYSPQWFLIPSPKDITIAHFKRGFGGSAVPLVTAEYYFSGEHLHRTFSTRLQAFFAATDRVMI